jgi:hypothetical protein
VSLEILSNRLRYIHAIFVFAGHGTVLQAV